LAPINHVGALINLRFLNWKFFKIQAYAHEIQI
jgi:hypothetical protein